MKNWKPLFWHQTKSHKIDLIEKNVLATSDKGIAKTFKEYFEEIVPKFNITQNECHIQKTGNIEDPESLNGPSLYKHNMIRPRSRNK